MPKVLTHLSKHEHVFKSLGHNPAAPATAKGKRRKEKVKNASINGLVRPVTRNP
jgi:hypothetical protein